MAEAGRETQQEAPTNWAEATTRITREILPTFEEQLSQLESAKNDELITAIRIRIESIWAQLGECAEIASQFDHKGPSGDLIVPLINFIDRNISVVEVIPENILEILGDNMVGRIFETMRRKPEFDEETQAVLDQMYLDDLDYAENQGYEDGHNEGFFEGFGAGVTLNERYARKRLRLLQREWEERNKEEKRMVALRVFVLTMLAMVGFKVVTDLESCNKDEVVSPGISGIDYTPVRPNKSADFRVPLSRESALQIHANTITTQGNLICQLNRFGFDSEALHCVNGTSGNYIRIVVSYDDALGGRFSDCRMAESEAFNVGNELQCSFIEGTYRKPPASFCLPMTYYSFNVDGTKFEDGESVSCDLKTGTCLSDDRAKGYVFEGLSKARIAAQNKDNPDFPFKYYFMNSTAECLATKTVQGNSFSCGLRMRACD